MQEAGICGACLDVLSDPVVLTCGHSVCFECVEDLVAIQGLREEQSDLLSCPTCRLKTRMPAMSTQTLTVNTLLARIIPKPMNSGSGVCIVCSSRAEYECMACDISICLHCQTTHMMRFPYHKVAKPQGCLCKIHSLPFDLYCISEYMFLCNQCVKESLIHNGHEVLTLTEARMALRSVRNDMKGELRERNEQLIAALSNQREVFARLSQSELNLMEDSEEMRNVRICFRTEMEGKMKKLEEDVQFYEEVEQTQDILEYLSRAAKLTSVYLPSFESCASKQLQNESCPALLQQGIPPPVPKPVDPVHLLHFSRGNADYTLFNFDSHSFQNLSLTSGIIPRWSMLTVLDDTRVLVTGGKKEKSSGALTSAFSVLISSGLTNSLSPMLSGHSSHVAQLIDTRVYVFGGKNQMNLAHRLCEYLDLASGQWVSISPMVKERTCAGGLRLNDFVYVLGGYQTTVVNSIEQYSLSTDSWTLLDTLLPDKLWQHACLPLSERQVLVLGGESRADEQNRVSYIWDVDSGTFSHYESIPIREPWFFFWLHVIRRGNSLYAMNKDRQVVTYSICRNKWRYLTEQEL